jgi:hypothetical protein
LAVGLAPEVPGDQPDVPRHMLTYFVINVTSESVHRLPRNHRFSPSTTFRLNPFKHQTCMTVSALATSPILRLLLHSLLNCLARLNNYTSQSSLLFLYAHLLTHASHPSYAVANYVRRYAISFSPLASSSSNALRFY